MFEIPDLRGLDFGQADMMDIKKIYETAAPQKVALTCLKPSRDDLVSGKALIDFPTDVVFVYKAETIDDAREIVMAYRR